MRSFLIFNNWSICIDYYNSNKQKKKKLNDNNVQEHSILFKVSNVNAYLGWKKKVTILLICVQRNCFQYNAQHRNETLFVIDIQHPTPTVSLLSFVNNCAAHSLNTYNVRSLYYYPLCSGEWIILTLLTQHYYSITHDCHFISRSSWCTALYSDWNSIAGWIIVFSSLFL